MRSVSQGFSQTFLLIAFSLMPLAGAIAINFSSPLFATLVSALLLKEAVGMARWAALLVGFCGVLIVTNPGPTRSRSARCSRSRTPCFTARSPPRCAE